MAQTSRRVYAKRRAEQRLRSAAPAGIAVAAQLLSAEHLRPENLMACLLKGAAEFVRRAATLSHARRAVTLARHGAALRRKVSAPRRSWIMGAKVKNRALSRYALSCCVASAMLAGCGGSQPPIAAPGAMPKSISASAQAVAQRAIIQLRRSFLASTAPTARTPATELLDWNGKLYGTTNGGYSESQALGNVFSITTTGKEKVVYDFHLRPDGNDPTAPATKVACMVSEPYSV